MKSLIFTLSLLCFSILTIAQTSISGTIVDKKGETIIGANVFLKDTYDGASSDTEGAFSFTTTETGALTLAISYIGYETYEQVLICEGKALTLSITLKEMLSKLDAVVITAGAFEASDKRKAVVLNSIDIVTTASSNGDIYGALNTLPGTQKVGESGQLFVRGGAAYETRTFIDGMLVQKPYSSSVPDVPSRGRFSPFLFKGTLFSTGGYSAEYGQALSSALILETQDLAPESSTSIGLMTIGASLARTERWEKTSLSISGDYTNLAPYTSMAKQNIDWIKPFQGLNGQLSFRHETSETGIFKFYANGSRNGFSMNYPDTEELGRVYQLDLNNHNVYLNTSYKEILNDKWTLFAGMAYTNNADEVEEEFQVKTKDESIQGRFTLSNQVNDQVKVKVGAEYLYQNFDERFRSENNQNFTTQLFENYVSGFAETSVYLTEKLVGQVGGRLEYSQILDRWNVAPRLSLAYKTGAKSQVSFAAGRFYQNPENDLLRYRAELDYEQADHFMLNYQLIKNGRVFRTEIYQKNYNGLVKYDSEKPWISNNDGQGHARGIDVFFRDRKSIKYGDYWISYSFLDTERDYRDFPTAATPTFAAKHNASIVYKHWFPKLNMQVGMTYSVASGRPYNNPNEIVFNGARTKAYNDLSLNASYLTNIFGNFTVFHVALSNAAGFDNTFGYRYNTTPNNNGVFEGRAVKPTAKRFFFVGMFMTIGESYKGEEPEN